MFDSFDFPDAPKFRAKWKPIYFEPIVNSGERVTILIVVKDENSIKYYEALHESVIDSLYGAKSVAFKNLVKYIKEQLIKNSGELNNCIEGVYPGDWHSASSADIKGIARQGLKLSASLGTLAINELHSEQEEHDKIDQNWTSRIKGEFIKSLPQYERAFNYNYSITNNVKIRCGFYAVQYAARFNVCTLKTIGRMKTSLLDLKILEEHKASNRFDLILQVPEVDGIHITTKTRNKMNENIQLLKEQCQGSSIEVFTCENEKEGAERLIQMLNVA
ncbi:hypothetical protein [Acinetobacter pittii]|uniref:hypothetical protein n=1 Tax=Acinetobacter pittii TaxID=48296 RepID=UPI00300DAC33